jgi:ABC-2 type transport system permease protein
MNSYLRLTRKELLGLLRTQRVLITLIVFGGFGLLAPLLARLLPEMVAMVDPAAEEARRSTVHDAVVQFVNLVSQMGSLALIFLTMGIVCSEKSDGTMPFLMVKPIHRAWIILAKFTAIAALALFGTLVAAVGTTLATPVIFGSGVPWSFVISTVLVFAMTLSTVAIVLPASTVFRSQAAAGTVSTLVWMLLSALADLPNLGRILPGRITRHAVGVLGNVPIDPLPLLGILGMVLIALGLSVTVFQRWEPA